MNRIAMIVCSVGVFALSSLSGCAMSAQDAGSNGLGTTVQALGGSRPIHAAKYWNGELTFDEWDEARVSEIAYEWRYPTSIDDRIPTGESSGYIYVNFGDDTGRWVWIADMRQPTQEYDRTNTHFMYIQLVDVPSPSNPQWEISASGGGPSGWGKALIQYSGHY